MAATATATATEAEEGRPAMVVGIDDSEHSFYALEWTLQHLFTGAVPPFKLVVVHAKPIPTAVVGLGGPVGLVPAGAPDVLPYIEADLKKISVRIIERAKGLCDAASASDVVYEVVEGDARNVLCETVEKYHAHILAVGSHGYGAIKRAVLGSVSDYCAHHAHCTVMIVRKPKSKH